MRLFFNWHLESWGKVGDNHKAAPVTPIDFCFIGKKTEFGKSPKKKIVCFWVAEDRFGTVGEQPQS